MVGRLLLAGVFWVAPVLASAPAAPARLSETGLYAAGSSELGIAAENLAFSPQYPLWSDGAAKRRWIHLPAGTAIDSQRPQDWEFPAGTKLWKEFSFGGRKVETRLLWKATSADWVLATYVWNEAQDEAVLAPAGGIKNHFPMPSSSKRHDIPGVLDCRACHESRGKVEVLGFSALQLSNDRDPGAPHAEPLLPGMVTLRDLVERKWLQPERPEWVIDPPRIRALSPRARSAIGYLSANCGGCHRSDGDLAMLGLDLRHPLTAQSEKEAPAFATTWNVPSRFQVPGVPDGGTLRVKPGDPGASALHYRMASRSSATQMPPLGTKLVDEEARSLVEAWIRDPLGRVSD